MPKNYFKRTLAICAFALFTAAALPSGHAGQAMQTDRNGRAMSVDIRKALPRLAAGGNPAVCKANYEQCVKACDGMASCTNQCAANYRGCLGV